MRLKTRMQLALGATVVLALAAAILLAIGLKSTEAALGESVGMDSLVVDLYELRILSLEYEIGPLPRISRQWRAKYDEIGRGIEAATGLSPEIEEAFANAREVFEAIASFGSPEVSRDPLRVRLRSQLFSTLHVESQRIIDWAKHGSEDFHFSLVQRQRGTDLGILAALVLLMMITSSVAILTVRHLLSSISLLRNGTETIARGDLEHRMALRGPDELSDLAHSFNSMAADLHASYARLERSERRFRSIIENVTDIFFQTDSHGILLLASASAASTLGFERLDDMIGRPFMEFWADDSRYKEMISIMESGGQLHDFEAALRKMDSTLLPVSVSGHSRKGPSEGNDGVEGVARDISERKRAEMTIKKQIMELEAKNSELERFTYTVSHDLKAPLITIKGFLGYLKEDAANGDEARLGKDIDRIASAATRMEHLLGDLLELSRIGRVANPPTRFGMREAVEEALSRTAGMIAERKAKVDVDEIMPEAVADRERIIEVWQNLIENAVKYSIPSSVPIIRAGAECNPEGTVFYLRDSGIGIDPKHIDRIFNLFEKIDPRSEGTGIGLALVKRIIDIHGGRAWVESEPGRGSTFKFTLGDVGEEGG